MLRRTGATVAARCIRSFATEALVAADAGVRPSQIGQPSTASHPHLLKPDELTPGIPAAEYAHRRKTLMDTLPENSVVVALAAPRKFMTGNIFYRFRQDSNFWYLTGFDEWNSAVILEKTSTSKGYRMTMFSAGKDANEEKWEGSRAAMKDVTSVFQADEARSIEHFPSHLKSLLSLYSHVYVDLPSNSKPRQKSILDYLSLGKSADNEFHAIVQDINPARRRPLTPELSKLRLFKSEAEQQLMRAAADISGKAFAKTMRFSAPGVSESAIEAHFEYLCRIAGAQRLAYLPVVASGPNGLIIHYTANNHIVQESDTILMDAGCEFNGYASDITRTFPANGTFSEPQRDLYSAVLAAQKALIPLCSEANNITLFDLHHRSCDFLQHELKQIGFQVSRRQLERTLYPHYVSHPIGIDLHESSFSDRVSRLKRGMVVTVEPGVYVPDSLEYPKHFRNLGVRIEDEVLVGAEHPTVLSVSAPKEIADVEGACQGKLGLTAF